MHTPIQDPILLEQETLGRGAFAVVTRVWDVSTGLEYASKKFFNPKRSDWKKEASVMRQTSHEHIVRLHFVVGEPYPQLILEYVPLGNLEDQHRCRKSSEDEAISTLQQALSALAFLHEQSLPIVHRDIKPENLLVQSRDPFHIKLGDFGLSKASKDLRTFCGTPLYLPPELARYCGLRSAPVIQYTHAVDIWSFGTVIYQYVYGLPNPVPGSASSWCKKIVKHLNDWESDELIDLLSRMVVIEPRRRLTAGNCFVRALQLDSRNRSSTPTGPFSTYKGYKAPAAAKPLDNVERPTLECEVLRLLAAGSATSIEKVSVLTTLVYDPKDGYKRQRSPGPNVYPESKRSTTIREDCGTHDITSGSQSNAVSTARICISGQRNTMYQSVLELLKYIQAGFDSSETLDSRTTALVHTLCQQLELLDIAEIKTRTDRGPDRTVLTGVSNAKEFTLASLTSSEVANSVADLAHHLIQVTDLLGLEPTTPHSSRSGRRS